MSKLLSFLFIGLFAPFLPSFFFFLGVKLHYIDFYEMGEFYNIIFVDNMPWIAFLGFGAIVALLFISPLKKLAATLLILSTVASFSMLVQTIGHDVSKQFLAKPNFHIKKEPWTYSGTLLYEGRTMYYLLEKEYQKVLEFKKDEIDEAY